MNHFPFLLRYNAIKNYTCEIQVRTVFQDAWAIVNHHLQYKRESSVPEPLRRQIHGIAAALELADTQLESLRTERLKYVASIRKQTDQEFLDQEVNADSFTEYLKRLYPDRILARTPGFMDVFPDDLHHYGYKTLRDVQRLLEITKEARDKFNEQEQWGKTAGREVFVALGLLYPEYRRFFAIDHDRKLLEKFSLHRTKLDS